MTWPMFRMRVSLKVFVAKDPLIDFTSMLADAPPLTMLRGIH